MTSLPSETAAADPPTEQSVASCVPSVGVVTACLAALGGALVASGDCGLLGPPLRHALAWLAMGVMLLGAGTKGFGTFGAKHPEGLSGKRFPTPFLLPLSVAVAVALSVPAGAVYNVAAVALVAAALAWLAGGVDRRALQVVATATAVLALERLAVTAIPLAWHLADAVGSTIGRVGSAVWGRPLVLGATFAGVDTLVLTAAVYAGWLLATPRPRCRRAFLAAAGILAAGLLYLGILAHAADLARILPVAPAVEPSQPYVPPPWSWSDAVRTLLPWNLPALAVAMYLAVVGMMFRWSTWSPPRRTDPSPAETQRRRPQPLPPSGVPPARDPAILARALHWAPIGLAMLLPLATVFAPGKADLEGKRILVLDRGDLDWQRPVHGAYGAESAGTCGMLPEFVESLGGRLVRTQQLTAEQLAAADVLLLFHPNRPWSDAELDLICDYVAGGGSLLVAAGPRMVEVEEGRASSFNEVLRRVGMQVRFDVATGETAHWREACQAMAHPVTAGRDGDRHRFGLSAAASIETGLRGRPLLVGRFGWSDPGSDALLTGSSRWNAGRRLGDLVLAAERRLGRGRVVVLGDATCLTNLGSVRAFSFTGRLLAYLACRSPSPQAAWRQTLGLVLLGALVGLLFRRQPPWMPAATVLALCLSLACCRGLTRGAMRVLPDAGRHSPANVAYLDASHVEAPSGLPWADEAVDGLCLTLMRNGFLPLVAPDLKADRLERAALVISIAPARGFSLGECRRVRKFVEDGGVFILTAGACRAGGARSLLAEFGFGLRPYYRPPGAPDPDPQPMGCFYQNYPDGSEYQSTMIFFAGWPVDVLEPGITVIARGPDDRPVIAMAQAGSGCFLVVGDSHFAMNQCLEAEDGSSLDGGNENAHFWRWLFGYLTQRPAYLPPPFDIQEPGAAARQGQSGAAEGADVEPAAGPKQPRPAGTDAEATP